MPVLSTPVFLLPLLSPPILPTPLISFAFLSARRNVDCAHLETQMGRFAFLSSRTCRFGAHLRTQMCRHSRCRRRGAPSYPQSPSLRPHTPDSLAQRRSILSSSTYETAQASRRSDEPGGNGRAMLFRVQPGGTTGDAAANSLRRCRAAISQRVRASRILGWSESH